MDLKNFKLHGKTKEQGSNPQSEKSWKTR